MARLLAALIFATVLAAGCAQDPVVSFFTSCPANTTVCFALSDKAFASGCANLTGQVITRVNDLPLCVVKGPVSQVSPCGGQSCSLSVKNFTDGCVAIGGFVSGAVGNGQIPVCALLGNAVQFGPCPPDTSVCSMGTVAQFEQQCQALGGFIDGFTGPSFTIPECTVKGPLSYFTPCGSQSCSYSETEFTAGCKSIGGQITAEADNLPVCYVSKRVASFGPCPLPDDGRGCSFSSTNFAAACTGLGGFISATDASQLPICTVAVA